MVLKTGAKKDSIEYNFNKIKDPITFLNDIKKGKISIQEAKDKQENYYNFLKKIRKGNKSSNQKILTCFLMQEIVQSNFIKIIVQ